MLMARPTYTATEQRIISALAAGILRTREELHQLLPDDLGDLRNVRAHISNLRRKLEPQGKSIQCVMVRGMVFYRLVRLIKS